MGKQWYYFLFMLWLSYLIVSSILLFGKGFLLSKNAQHKNSSCVAFGEVPCVPEESSPVNSVSEQCSLDQKLSFLVKNVKNATNLCLPKKSRIIFLLIDALRYDFAVFNDEIKTPMPYQNKLPVLKRLLEEHPKSTRLFKFIADPPTTTMQRIKALTTGSLPTFIDAGSNFATNEINEDNIIDQLINHNLSTVLIGDDTWDGLYPNRFLRKYPYPSFDVWDLDTVDDGVTEHLFPEAAQKDWSFLIAHYLGVDHCGHRYGPDHPEMDRKLTEMNNVIEKLVEKIDTNTMLFVIGDHGMSETGNHGGDSEDEVSSAFFIYSKQPLSHFGFQSETVRQISIVPTMAAIFGVSVPFSNLGTVILDALPIMNRSSIEEWQWSLFYLWGNVQQVMTYIEDYAKTSTETFTQQELKDMKQKFSILNSKMYSVTNEETFREFASECTRFLEKLLETCETIWIQFDSFSMTRGLLFLFLSLFFAFIITDGIPRDRLHEIFIGSYLKYSYSILFIAIGVSVLLTYFNLTGHLLPTIYFSTGLVSQFLLALIVIQNWEIISLNWYDRSKKDKIPNLVCRVVFILYLCGLFSNSFVVEESSVLLFLLATVIGVISLTVFNKETKKKVYRFKWRILFAAFVILILVRLSMYYWTCRDRLEQPWCFETANAFTLKSESTKLQWFITVITLGIFVTITKEWLRSCGNLNGFDLTVILLKYVPTVLVVCMSGYWVLNRLPHNSRNKSTSLWQINSLAWVVYFFSIFGIIYIVVKSLLVYLIPSKDEVLIENQDNIISKVFQQVKNKLNRPTQQEVPVICGLATVYSAVYVSVAVFLILLFALLHGDSIAPSTVIMFLASMFILGITSIIRLEKAITTDDLFDISNMSLLIWMFLSQYFFYGTGHQPSFPNIMWNAAFVGTSGIFNNVFIQGSLIILNTFCSHILMGLLVPLIIIAPFTLSVMLPSIINKNVIEKGDFRGELLLYERREEMITVTFTTICKYMIFHGVRVFGAMLSATIHCRHMMIWKIFAPKLIFESVGIFITLVIVNLSYLILIRINSKVNNFVLRLNKLS